MNHVFVLGLVAAWAAILMVCWLGWLLLRQNGRILLRLDEVERWLDELEFGGSDQPDAESRNGRFSSGSLARSKIKRDGLNAGTHAPDFRLPRLDGRGELSLQELRGKRVLLIFSNPNCGPCQTLAPDLERFYRQNGGNPRWPSPRPSPPGEGVQSLALEVVMVSRGEPKENRAKVKEHGLTFPVLLQQRWEISRRYAMFATPIAYLIDENGVIFRDVAVGVDRIQALLSVAANGDIQNREASFVLNSAGKT